MRRKPGRHRADNPSVRYTTVVIDTDGDRIADLELVVRGGRRDEALRAAAGEVDPEAWIDLQETRTFPTKYEALAHAQDAAPEIRELASTVPKAPR